MRKAFIVVFLLCSLISQGQNTTAGSKIVGSIGGTINVSSLGGAVYSIPLELPDGVNGMKPSINIVYNSQGGNGLLGYGWDINGISSITRTGSTLYHNGKKSAADLSTDDNFVLDGNRLVHVGTSGNDEEFKTENDEFSKVVFHKENGYYSNCDVWMENGNVIKYGYTLNSKLMASDGNNVIKWMVSSIEDRNGNTISYTYEPQVTSSDIYISQISYTSNAMAPLSPEFTVAFTYSNNRFDPYHYYIAGNKVETKKLLSRIDVLRLSYSIESYDFSYDSCLGRMYNLLTSITLSKGNYSLNPTIIEWNTIQNDIDNNGYSGTQINTSFLNGFTYTGDFNGDGYTDVLTVPYKPSGGYTGNVTLNIHINDKSGNFATVPDITTSVSSDLEWIHVLDINNDSYDDLIIQTLSSSGRGNDRTYNTAFTVYESLNGNSFSSVYSINKTGKVLAKAGDFLGEGKNGLLLIEVIDTNNGYYINSCPSILHYGSTYSTDTFIDPIYDMGVVIADDFSGDGKTELAVFNSLVMARYEFGIQNNAYRVTCLVEDLANYEGASYFSGDFNDDGKADVIFNDMYNNKYVILSTGTGFTDWISVPGNDIRNIVFPQMSLYNYSLASISQGFSYGVYFADIDGDGKTDLIHFNGDNTPLFFRNFHIVAGNQTTGDFKIKYFASSGSIKFINQYFTIGNFLGRDNMSFIAVDPVNPLSPSDDIVKLFSFPSTKAVFSVDAITNGFGIRTEIQYAYMMPGSSGFYNFVSRQCLNEIRPVPMPMLAMKDYAEFIDSHIYTTSFKYTNALLHRTGRGFVGFDAVTRTTSVDNSPIKMETGLFEAATMGVNAVALPSVDSVFYCSSGNHILVETNEYYFDDVRCSRSLLSDGRMLVTRPAMVSKKTKKYNPDTPGTLLSVTIDDYTYNYLSNNTYADTYGCIESANGVNRTDCANASICEFRNTKIISLCNNDYNNWIINRVSAVVSESEMSNKPSVTRVTEYEYANGNPFNVATCTTKPSLTLGDPQTTRTAYTYDACGNITSKTLSAPYGLYDEPSITTQFGYSNSRILLSETTDPSGLAYQESYMYDAYDRVTCRTGANGLSTTYSYINAFGSKVTTTTPDNITLYESTEWSGTGGTTPAGALYQKVAYNQEGATYTTYYNAAGDVIRSVRLNHELEPVMTDYVYYRSGLVAKESNQYLAGDTVLWVKYYYDMFDRPVLTIFPDGKTIINQYDGYSVVTTITADNTSRSQTKTINPMGWIVSSEDAGGNEVFYDYNPDGRLASSSTSGGNVVVEMEYDNAGNRSLLSDPDYGETTSAYDAYCRMVSQETPKGDVFIFTYDVMGRLTCKTTESEEFSTIYQYNENSHKGTLASITHDEQSISYSYDMYDRKNSVSETRGTHTYLTSYQYDAMSRLKSTVFPSGFKVIYGYYPDGTLEYVNDTNNFMLWHTDDINSYGSLLRATTGNGAVTNNTYDIATNMLRSTVTSDSIQKFFYTYDKWGNLTSRTDSLKLRSEYFEYDNLDRLVEIVCGVNSSSMTYDCYGRMTGRELDGGTVFHSALFDVDKPHAIVGADANMNCFPDMQSVKYNVLDKVEQITQGRYRVNFEYGYDNQRMSMTKVDNIANATYTKDYVGNCEFIDNNGNDEVRTYLAGPAGVFAVVVQKGNTTNIDYVYKDNLGSWTTIADSTKRVVERMSYDAWGNLRDATTWCGNFGRLPKYERGFTGHEHLYEFGLINMNGRMYDPMSASFLSPDSYIQDPTTQQGFNRYAYCAYNPLKYVDPSGELYFGWVNIEYMIEQEIKHKCREDQYRLYEIVTSIHELTMFMAGTLFSQGMDDFGNGSGNHGSPGGGGYSTDFINKCLELGITPGMSIPKEKQTDEFLKQFQETFFPDAPMEYVKKFVVEGLDKESEFLRGTTWNQAKTIPDWENDMFSGYSSVYFNEDIVFKNPEDLFYAMGHELVHVGQIIELAGDPRQNWCEGLAYVMDVYAYSWMGIMGRPPKYWNTNKQYTKEWQSHRSCLNYTNFPWLLNIPHP